MGQCFTKGKGKVEKRNVTTPNKSTIENNSRHFRKSTVHPLTHFRKSDDRSAITQLDGWLRRMNSAQVEDINANANCATN